MAVICASFLVYACVRENEINHTRENTFLEKRTGIGKSCIPDIKTNLVCSPGIFPTAIQLPQYPGCTFYISANYVRCSDWALGTEYIHMGDFSIIEHDCPQFNTDMTNAINNGTKETFIAQFNGSVWGVLTNYLLSQTNGIWSNTVLEYMVAACNQICIVEKRFSDTQFTALVPVNNRCSEDCCRRITNYIKINGQWEVYSNSITEGPECEIITASCPANTVDYTNCIKNCSQFIYF